MREYGDKRIADRANDATRHVCFREIEDGVNRGDNKVEFGQNVVIEMKRAVEDNVAFDAAKETDAMKLQVQGAERRLLCAQFCFVSSVRLGRAAGVLGDAELFQAH